MSFDRRDRRRSGAALTAATLVLTAGLLAAAATAGSAPTGATVPVPAARSALDYRPDAGRPVAPVRPEFIERELGLAFVKPGLGRDPVVAAGGDEGPPPVAPIAAKDFRCVGGRQTDDPLAPPCDDSNFTGDNGGATWNGVTRDEVRILIRVEGAETLYLPPTPVRSTVESGHWPADAYYDLGLPAHRDEPIGVDTFRDLQDYFNRRYQTYGRRIRFVVYFDDAHTHTIRNSRRLAVENDAVARPFAAVVLNRDVPFVDEYLAALAARGVVGFDGANYRSRHFYSRSPGRLWTYHASIEQQAELFSTYVCTKVRGHRVVMGGPGLNGRPRRIAMLSTSNPSQTDYRELARRIKQGLAGCGVELAEEATYRTNGEQCTNLVHEQDEADVRQARDDMSRFRAAGITTILWPGCPTSAHLLVANAEGWFPEWIVVGDPFMAQAGIGGALGGATLAWDRHAVMVSSRVYEPPVWQTRCWQAIDEVGASSDVEGRPRVCRWFGALQQVITGVQLAGPRLEPATVADGLRRLRVFGASDPQAPTCVYTPEDFSCIKDGQALVFHTDGGAREFDPVDGLASGWPYPPQACWRAIEGGRRYAPGEWPPGNVDAQTTSADPCSYDEQITIRRAVSVGRL